MRSYSRILVLAAPILACSAAFVAPRTAVAQATNFRQEWDDIKSSIPYLGSDRAPIDFTERAPLVVPPSNELPPPGAGARLSLTDPDELERIKAKSDARRPVPADDPGAAATGAAARAYLIEPPSGMRDPAAVASEASADGFKDAPKRKKGTSTAKVHKVRRTPAVAVAQ